MNPSPLKNKLEQCSTGPFYKANFSISHLGSGTLHPFSECLHGIGGVWG